MGQQGASATADIDAGATGTTPAPDGPGQDGDGRGSNLPAAMDGVETGVRRAPRLEERDGVAGDDPVASDDATTSAGEDAGKGAESSDDQTASGDPAPSTDATASADEDAGDDSDRRHSERITLEVEIGLASDSNFFTGFSEDISSGGVFVATYNLLPIGSEVVLAFTLIDGHPVCANGRVAWLREAPDLTSDLVPGIGVAFTSLAPSDQDAIDRFIALRDPLFFDI